MYEMTIDVSLSLSLSVFDFFVQLGTRLKIYKPVLSSFYVVPLFPRSKLGLDITLERFSFLLDPLASLGQLRYTFQFGLSDLLHVNLVWAL